MVLAWVFVLGLVQVFDVGVHVATGKIEPLRVAASVLIAGWAIVAVVRGAAARGLAVQGALGAYLLLNAVFVALEGVTNPAQGGAVRWMLFALVAATTVAVLGLAAARVRRPDGSRVVLAGDRLPASLQGQVQPQRLVELTQALRRPCRFGRLEPRDRWQRAPCTATAPTRPPYRRDNPMNRPWGQLLRSRTSSTTSIPQRPGASQITSLRSRVTRSGNAQLTGICSTLAVPVRTGTFAVVMRAASVANAPVSWRGRERSSCGPDSRHEMFGKIGVTCGNFRDPNDPNATGVMADIPDMAEFQELLQSEEGQTVMREDGLKVETLRVLVEFTP